MEKINIYFLFSHPVQYNTPLLKYLNRYKNFNVEAIFCDKGATEKRFDKDFNTDIKWDIPLFDGYLYKVMKNYAINPGIDTGFFGLMNWGIIQILWKIPKNSLVVINGWNFFTNILALLVGKLLGLKIALRGDCSMEAEKNKSKSIILLKKIILGKLLFNIVDYIFIIGKNSRYYFDFYNANPSKYIFTPFSVDNDSFLEKKATISLSKNSLREELGLPKHGLLFLFSGKLIDIKKPLDLLLAYNKVGLFEHSLVFVGDGILKEILLKKASELQLKNIIVTGFINQGNIHKYYAAADVFILCSEKDQWGLSVNEAMLFELPLILSSGVGSAIDLVSENENGYVYQAGNIDELSHKLKLLTALDISELLKMGTKSKLIINEYSYEKIKINIEKKLLNK